MKLRIKNVSRKRLSWSLFSQPHDGLTSGVLANLSIATIDQLLSDEFRDELRATRRILTGADTTTPCDESEEL
jgi:hypothetical protein